MHPLSSSKKNGAFNFGGYDKKMWVCVCVCVMCVCINNRWHLCESAYSSHANCHQKDPHKSALLYAWSCSTFDKPRKRRSLWTVHSRISTTTTHRVSLAKHEYRRVASRSRWQEDMKTPNRNPPSTREDDTHWRLCTAAFFFYFILFLFLFFLKKQLRIFFFCWEAKLYFLWDPKLPWSLTPANQLPKGRTSIWVHTLA